MAAEFSPDRAASAAAEAVAEEGRVVLESVSTSQPVRLPHGYQFTLYLGLSNPALQPSPPFEVWLKFATGHGQSVTCRNLSVPSGISEGGGITGSSLLPEQFLSLGGEVLVPITWYRGPGVLEVSVRPCFINGEGRTQCPQYDPTAPDARQLIRELMLP